MDGAAEITRDSDALGKAPKVSDLFKNELTKKNWKVIDIASPAGGKMFTKGILKYLEVDYQVGIKKDQKRWCFLQMMFLPGEEILWKLALGFFGVV